MPRFNDSIHVGNFIFFGGGVDREGGIDGEMSVF